MCIRDRALVDGHELVQEVVLSLAGQAQHGRPGVPGQHADGGLDVLNGAAVDDAEDQTAGKEAGADATALSVLGRRVADGDGQGVSVQGCLLYTSGI